MSEPDPIVALLTDARKLIAEKGWTSNSLARDAAGQCCDPTSAKAACFCIVGALNRAAWDIRPTVRQGHKSQAFVLLEAVTRRRSGRRIADFNDTVADSPETILSVFDEAIAARQQKPEATHA